MELQQRMRLTTTGQVTWADPERNKNARCDGCRHFSLEAQATKRGSGSCYLVQVMTKRKGVLFFGDKALACSKYEARK